MRSVAEQYDETSHRYRGLKFGRQANDSESDSAALIVRSEVAHRQTESEQSAPHTGGQPTPGGSRSTTTTGGKGGTDGGPPPPPPPPPRPKRFHGSVVLNTQRVGRDAGRIAEEIIQHLALQPGAEVEVTLEIDARMPAGAPENIVRIVTENARTLKFDDQGFEIE